MSNMDNMEDTISHIINQIINDPCRAEYHNDVGCAIKDYYTIEININCNLNAICKKCNFEFEVLPTENHYGFCDKCDEFFSMDELVDEIIYFCKYNKYEMEEYKEHKFLNWDAELYKIKFIIDDIDNNNNDHNCNNNDKNKEYFGVMLCAIDYEPNSWSSTPHNNYLRKFILFNDIEKRNNFYDDTPELANEKFGHHFKIRNF